jgi:ABC-type Fe3+ transport system substrate-binding protein
MRIAVFVLAATTLVLSACQSPAPAAVGQTGAAPSAAQAPGARASQPPGGSELSPEVQRLVRAARDNGETELNVAWSLGQLGGLEGAKRAEALMNQMYGTNIKVNLTPGPSPIDLAAKIAQELLVGQKASSDAYFAIATNFATLLPRDVLETYDYTQLSPRFSREVVSDPPIGVEVYGSIPVLLYNTDLVRREEVPRRLEDVLQPQWKDKIATTETASYFEAIAMRPEWGVPRMKAFIGRLSEHVGGLVRMGSAEHGVVSGQFLMVALGNSQAARHQAAAGAPLAGQVPEDAAQVNTLYLGVPRNSAHPNLAKLYIHAIMSEAGQRILYETSFVDHYQLPGSQSAAELADLYAKGVAIHKANVKFFQEHPELPELTRELQTILREKRSG